MTRLQIPELKCPWIQESGISAFNLSHLKQAHSTLWFVPKQSRREECVRTGVLVVGLELSLDIPLHVLVGFRDYILLVIQLCRFHCISEVAQTHLHQYLTPTQSAYLLVPPGHDLSQITLVQMHSSMLVEHVAITKFSGIDHPPPKCHASMPVLSLHLSTGSCLEMTWKWLLAFQQYCRIVLLVRPGGEEWSGQTLYDKLLSPTMTFPWSLERDFEKARARCFCREAKIKHVCI